MKKIILEWVEAFGFVSGIFSFLAVASCMIMYMEINKLESRMVAGKPFNYEKQVWKCEVVLNEVVK